MSMSIDKVIEILDSGKAPETEQDFEDFDAAIETAINLLKTYADNQPNDPLTLEELREMEGEPVFVVNSSAKREDGFFDEWALVSMRRKTAESVGTIYHFENYGDYWLAYRCKTETTYD